MTKVTRKGKVPLPLVERFWPKVRVAGPDDCWEWTAHRYPTGYGDISDALTGRHHVYAHRASWEIAHGPIPDGMSVLHRCDNRGCVNPGHLFIGSQTDNVRDAISKGRHVPPPHLRGERNNKARLTDVQVSEIRERHAEGENFERLAEAFGVWPTSIERIVRYKIRR